MGFIQPLLLSQHTLAPGHCLAILSISRGSPWAAILGFIFPSEGFLHVHFNLASLILGLPWWLRQYRNHLQCGRPGFDPWVGKISWRAWQPTPVSFSGESQRQRSLAGYSLWGHTESHTTEVTQHAYTQIFSKMFPLLSQPKEVVFSSCI